MNASGDGGTLYPVADSSWIEGSGDDVPGPGLTWSQVDTNNDRIVDAKDTSPFVPDFTRPLVSLGKVAAGKSVSVDLTAALQAGPGLYTFAIANADTNGATYASRESATAANRPVLRVQSVGCRSDAECDDGLFCNGSETCAAGQCVAGAAPACDDGVGCTADRCDEATRTCVHTANDAACDDGVACTIDRCDQSAGACVHTASDAACDDASVCTSDTCDATLGCRHADSGLCQPETIALDAAADTYVESGVESTWDHGASDHLDVDASPVDIAYLAFDLRGIDRLPTSATLTLHCTNAAPDGGTIYPVHDSTWVEGTANGRSSTSQSGQGMKWRDVDTNGDDVVDGRDTSPWVPDVTPIVAIGAVSIGQTITVDVTSALRAGPGLYTLAIRSGSGNGVTYSSRQNPTASVRPKLTLVLPPRG